MNAFIEAVGHWFGFVGSCVASPTGACIPFAAFLAVLVTASAALVGLYVVYRPYFRRDAGESRRARQSRVHAPLRERMRFEPHARKPASAGSAAPTRHVTA